MTAYAIKIIKCRTLDLQRPGGDVISKEPLRQSVEAEERASPPTSHLQGFVINANGHVTILYELVNGEQCIVWLSIKGGDILSRKSSFGVAGLTSTTVSETFGEGRIENVANIRSGYSCIDRG